MPPPPLGRQRYWSEMMMMMIAETTTAMGFSIDGILDSIYPLATSHLIA